MTQVMVTGASGVLGRALVQELLKRKRRVLAVTRCVERFSCDESDTELLNVVSWGDVFAKRIDTEGLSVVIHCGFSRSQNGADLASSMNLSEKLFRWATDNSIPSLINISSQSIYGKWRNVPSKEDDLVDPLDAYALAKLACERLGENITKDSATVFSSIRLASLIGPEFEERIVFKMLRGALCAEKISIIGGKQEFSFMDIRDAVSGILQMLEVDSSLWRPLYNLGTEDCYSIVQLAETIKSVVFNNTNKTVLITVRPEDINLKTALNCDLFKHDFSFVSKYDLVDSVEYIYMKRFSR